MQKKSFLLSIFLSIWLSLLVQGQSFPRFSEALMNKLTNAPYPRLDQPAFWIRDIKGEPVLGAKIEFKFLMPGMLGSQLAQEQLAMEEKPHLSIAECDEQGIYLIDSLPQAWYTVSIKARGYANIEFNVVMGQGSKQLFKILMCPPSYEPIYWNWDPLFFRPEEQPWTVFRLQEPINDGPKSQAKLTAIMTELQKEIPFQVKYHGGMAAIQWPAADSTQRKLKKLLEQEKSIESEMYSFSPDPFYGAYVMRKCELVVQGTHDSLAIRKYFWDFDCKVMYPETKGEHKSIRMMLTYRGVLHLDYLRRIANFMRKNPVSLVQMHSGQYNPPPGIQPPTIKAPMVAPVIRKPK